MKKSKARGSSFVVTEELANSILDGDDDYGTYRAFLYYNNLITATDVSSPVAYKICHVIEDNLAPLGNLEMEGKTFPLKKPKGKDKEAYPELASPGKDRVLKDDWEHIKAYFKLRLDMFEQPIEKTTIFKNIDLLSDALFLSDIDREILSFLHVAQNDELMKELTTDIIGDDIGRQIPLLSRFLGRPKDVQGIAKALEFKSPLIGNGIILPHDFENGEVLPDLMLNIQELLPIVNLEAETITERMLGKPTEAALQTSDFSYLLKEIAKIKKIIKTAVEKGETGVNILLYGPAGSGKTELAKAIAAELELTMFSIGEEDNDESLEGSTSKTSAQHRIGELFQAHSFLKGNKSALLFFDELEDLQIKGTDTDKKADTYSKIVVNRLLENNPVVTIWAGNDPDKFHESLRQRFSYSVFVDYPPVLMRVGIWKKQMEIHDVELPEKDVISLARRYQAPGRMIANAIRMSSLSEVSIDNIEDVLKESSRITYGHVEEIASRGGVGDHFRRTLFNYDKSKHNYVSEIIFSGQTPRPYSILTKGIPGTGLRSFGRYMAEKGAMNPIEVDMRQLCTASMMSSPPANIRSAFTAAADNRGLLIVSHLDALCENPHNSNSGWQKDLSLLFSEMVSRHKLPVIVSSYRPDLEIPGYMKDIFSLDLNIQPLDGELCALAYDEYFPKTKKPTEEIAFPKGLVPGDFARASHILNKDLNGGATHGKIMAHLHEQLAARSEQTRSLGFM